MALITPNNGDWHCEKGYQFSGLFYKSNNGQNCRRVLDIKQIGSTKKQPDLMVIMMNPGGSFPVNKSMECSKAKKGLTWSEKYAKLVSYEEAVFVPTCPDDTQYKVIEFMAQHNFSYARILNLSDVCHPNSGSLTKGLITVSPNYKQNYSDIHCFFKGSAALLLGWGCKDIFNDIIDHIILKVVKPFKGRIFGLSHHKKKKYFLHPRARNYYLLANKYPLWIDGVKCPINKTEII